MGSLTYMCIYILIYCYILPMILPVYANLRTWSMVFRTCHCYYRSTGSTTGTCTTVVLRSPDYGSLSAVTLFMSFNHEQMSHRCHKSQAASFLLSNFRTSKQYMDLQLGYSYLYEENRHYLQ